MSEIKAQIEDVMDDFKGRIRNPLILSFIFVWLYHHWVLVYKVFNISYLVPVDQRIDQFKHYIAHYGFNGMILEPLIFSFISLAAFYLIGGTAQYIKVLFGKRYMAWITVKVDKGNYVLKSVLEIEKRKLKNAQAELDKLYSDYHALIDLKTTAENDSKEISGKWRTAEDKIEELKSNITSNSEYKARLEITMMYFMSKFYKIGVNMDSNIVRSSYQVIDGNWHTGDSQSYTNTMNSYDYSIFKEGKIYDPKMTERSSINDFTYDRVNRIVRFVTVSPNDSTSYNLIKMSDDEFIGFKGGQFIRFKRAYMNLQN